MFVFKDFKKEISALKTLKQEGVLGSEAKKRVKGKVMFSLGEQNRSETLERKSFFQFAFIKVGFAVLAGFFIVGGTMFASASSLPGSILYPVKKLKEKVSNSKIYTNRLTGDFLI